MRPMIRLTLLLMFAPLLVGCLVNAHSHKIVGESEKRRAVEFENDAALRIFTEAVQDRYPDNKELGRSSFGVPFVIGASEERILSENAFFNQQVELADLNDDGEISEAEARAYARKWEE